MTNYPVSMLYDASIEIGYLNKGASFNKCGIKGCMKYALIKLPQ